MTCTARRQVRPARHPIPIRVTTSAKKIRGHLTMGSFSFNTAAELFPAAIRKKKRAGFAYRRFGTAAEAVRFAIEELPADSLNGAYLQVEEARFDQSGIRTLYESQAFPLPRRPACAGQRPRPTPTRRKLPHHRLHCPRPSKPGAVFWLCRQSRARLLVHPAPEQPHVADVGAEHARRTHRPPPAPCRPRPRARHCRASAP